MKRVPWFGAILIGLVLVSLARASVPVGIYARIDKVEFEPSMDNPERIKIHGDFMILLDTGRTTEVERGVVYFKLPEQHQDLARKEWNDLKKLKPGTSFVALGSATSKPFAVHVSPPAKKLEPRDAQTYPVGHGLTMMRSENVDPKTPVGELNKYLQEHPRKE